MIIFDGIVISSAYANDLKTKKKRKNVEYFDSCYSKTDKNFTHATENRLSQNAFHMTLILCDEYMGHSHEAELARHTTSCSSMILET